MLHLRLVVPPDRSDRVCRLLLETTGVTNVAVLEGAARAPAGDLVLCDVAREAADGIVRELTAIGLVAEGLFLALPYETDAALKNLANLREDFDAYGPGGFFDAVDVVSGEVAWRYLSLDQAMIMAAIGNELRHDVVKQYFVDHEFRKALRPLMAIESFLSRPAGD